MEKIAALYVEMNGVYFNLPNIEPWAKPDRDAREYDGPYPVVAHPPCARWCKLAGLVQSQYGYKIGDDDGCFAAALESVRRFGGVLEHPAFSQAWVAHELNHPPSSGGWVNADFEGGWTCHIEQGRYGHQARKATWLYAKGVELIDMRWGATPKSDVTATVSWANHAAWLRSGDERPRLTKAAASRSPEEFRDLLICMARSGRG